MKLFPFYLSIFLLFCVGLACKNTTPSSPAANSANAPAANDGNTAPDSGIGSAAGSAGQQTGDSRTIAGGLLNDKAVTLPQPSYPPTAKAVRAAGKVVVNVEVDKNGNVTSAEAKSGHPLLQAAAVAAARQAKFKAGPSPVSGSLEYDFKTP